MCCLSLCNVLTLKSNSRLPTFVSFFFAFFPTDFQAKGDTSHSLRTDSTNRPVDSLSNVCHCVTTVQFTGPTDFSKKPSSSQTQTVTSPSIAAMNLIPSKLIVKMSGSLRIFRRFWFLVKGATGKVMVMEKYENFIWN